MCCSGFYHIHTSLKLSINCLSGLKACIGYHATCKVDYANLSIGIDSDSATIALHGYCLSLYRLGTACNLSGFCKCTAKLAAINSLHTPLCHIGSLEVKGILAPDKSSINAINRAKHARCRICRNHCDNATIGSLHIHIVAECCGGSLCIATGVPSECNHAIILNSIEVGRSSRSRINATRSKTVHNLEVVSTIVLIAHYEDISHIVVVEVGCKHY